MKSYEVYAIRRIVLNWSKEKLAEKSGIRLRYIDEFEDGIDVGREIEDKHKSTINDAFKKMESMDHYNARILELAYELKSDTDNRQKLYRIGHLTVELGKLQRSILDSITIN